MSGAAAAIGTCQTCGARAEVREVDLNRTIGALVVRFQARIKAHLCRGCIRRIYWRYTLVTLLLGPWAPLSLLLTPVFLVANTYQYLRSLGMSEGILLPPGTSPGAAGAAGLPSGGAASDGDVAPRES